jgi:hypothetical protein
MTKTQKLGLLAAAMLIALSHSRSSNAQLIEGVWTGVESFETTVFQPFQPPVTYSASGPATFVFGNFIAGGGPDFNFDMHGDFSGSDVSGAGFLDPAVFGPNSASGTLFSFGGSPVMTVMNFALSYESILPNGEIDVGAGVALVDITQISNLDGVTSDTFATFETVPEPPSIVPAVLAVLVIAAVACTRGFWRRPQSRLS